jgi:predicted transcriptional regulator
MTDREKDKSDTIILPIKPKYCEMIFARKKKFELRKKIPGHIKRVVMYATAPVSMVVGEFSVRDVLYMPKEQLKQATNGNTGVWDDEFDRYFKNVAWGYAIKIGAVTRYHIDKHINYYGLTMAPQNYVYIRGGDER